MGGIPKLFQWLLAVGSFMMVWLAVILEYVQTDYTMTNRQFVFFLPVLLVIAFGLYSLAIILYRVATFNDCEEASEELKQQIKEAKADLRSKGINIKEDSENDS